jgi:periplasmic copper chaperone A
MLSLCHGIYARPNYASKLFRSVEEKLGIITLVLALLFAMVQTSIAHEFKINNLVLQHPWSRATPAGAQVAAGYAIIRNTGTELDRLIGVTTSSASRAELHEMSVQNGIMTMRQLTDGVVIPPHQEIVFAPGSYHIMLQDLKQSLKAGDSFTGTFTFEKAGKIDVTFKVEPMAAQSMDHH